MKTFFVAASLAAIAALSSSASAETENWTYKSNAADLYGPSQWSRVNAACAGKHQSPIDIKPTQGAKTYKQSSLPIRFSGKCPSYTIKQYWESFKAEAVNSTCALSVNGNSFNFAQVHFHSPAEHTLNGKAYDAEAHFVHKSANGSIAVVGLFVQKKKNAPSDTFFSNFLCELKDVNEDTSVAAKLGSFHAAVKTSVAKGNVFNYPGSLTTPGCTEPVDWWVIEKPLVVSETEFNQIKVELKRIGAANDGKNARPTQPLNDRKVIAY